MKTAPLLLVPLLFAGVVAGLYIATQHLAVFGIHGSVNVENKAYNIIDVSLNITEPRGVKVLQNITTITISNKTGIIARLLDFKTEGNMTLSINGRLLLRSENRTYTVDMPCLISIGEPCYRVQMLIPGYDKPLRIEPGTYTVTLIVSWTASGKGSFYAVLALDEAVEK